MSSEVAMSSDLEQALENGFHNEQFVPAHCAYPNQVTCRVSSLLAEVTSSEASKVDTVDGNEAVFSSNSTHQQPDPVPDEVPIRVGRAISVDENNRIVIDKHKSVTAPQRISMFVQQFGRMDAQGQPYTTRKIVNSFADLHVIRSRVCTSTHKTIKSASGWHCKSSKSVCKPCFKQKCVKLIGQYRNKYFQALSSEVPEIHETGGAPRLLRALADSLNLTDVVDYRDLHLLLMELGRHVTCSLQNSFCLLYACSGGDFVSVNKRFLGVLMSAGYRPLSDAGTHSASKRLANLWHPTIIWTKKRYLEFSRICPYAKDLSKSEERELYEQEVLLDSVQHVITACGDVNWEDLAQLAWVELWSARKILRAITDDSGC